MAYVEPVTNSVVVTTMSAAEQIKEKIKHLYENLQASLPHYEHQLHVIHQALLKSPDTVHLLTEQEVGIIVSGLSKKTGIIIAEKEKKKSANKKVTLEDLM